MVIKKIVRDNAFWILLLIAALCSPLFVVDSARAQDQNGITSPTSGDVVSGYVTIRGVANDPQFTKWQVDLLIDGDEQKATYIRKATGRKRAPANLTGFNSARYPDGNHTLRLRVVKQGGSYTEYFTPIVIDNSEQDTPGSGSGIERPKEGAKVNRMVRVRGIATRDGFRRWQLDLLPFGNVEDATFVAWGRRPVLFAAKLVDLDTELYPDGTHQLRLRVVYDNNQNEDHLTTITIDNSATPTDGNNGIIEPAEGEAISGTYRIRGIADHPEFQKWQLDLLRNGDESDATFIAWNAFPKPKKGLLKNLDTTLFPDGEHTLRLRVVRARSNYDEFFTKIVISNGGGSN